MVDYPNLCEVINEIRKNDIVAIYLFGAYATGKAIPTSDIDICVITKKDIPREVKEEILSNSSKRIYIAMFRDLPCTTRFKILKEGKLLYVKDHLILHRIKVDTLRSYQDFQPMIRRHISRIINK